MTKRKKRSSVRKKELASVKEVKKQSFFQHVFSIKDEYVYFVIPITAFALVLFLILNITVSQLIHPLYYKVANEDGEATVEMLILSKHLPEFKEMLAMQDKIFGPSIESEVFQREIQRNDRIGALEALLQKNPKARDVLYTLYKLYNENGEKGRAREYLDRAKEIDPTLQKSKL